MPYFFFSSERKNVGLPAGRISAHWGGHGHYRPAQPHAGGARDDGVAMEEKEPAA